MGYRDAQLYVERRTIKRLRLLLKLYPQSPKTEILEIEMRQVTADELADRLINEAITTNYPLVRQLEKLLASTEKTFMSETRRGEAEQQK